MSDKNLCSLVEARFRLHSFGLRDAQIAFGQRAALEQQLAAFQPVIRQRLVGDGAEELPLRFDDGGRTQFCDRLAGLNRLVGRDHHFLDQSAGGSGDDADLLLRDGNRAGQRNIRAAAFAVYAGGRDAGGAHAALVDRDRDVGGGFVCADLSAAVRPASDGCDGAGRRGADHYRKVHPEGRATTVAQNSSGRRRICIAALYTQICDLNDG